MLDTHAVARALTAAASCSPSATVSCPGGPWCY